MPAIATTPAPLGGLIGYIRDLVLDAAARATLDTPPFDADTEAALDAEAEAAAAVPRCDYCGAPVAVCTGDCDAYFTSCDDERWGDE